LQFLVRRIEISADADDMALFPQQFICNGPADSPGWRR
jgi:hypothetical protein